MVSPSSDRASLVITNDYPKISPSYLLEKPINAQLGFGSSLTPRTYNKTGYRITILAPTLVHRVSKTRQWEITSVYGRVTGLQSFEILIQLGSSFKAFKTVN